MKSHSNSQTPPGTQAVARAIAILKTLAPAAGGLGITELSVAMNLNKAAIFRLLGALEAEGMVTRDSAGTAYRLGPDVIALGTAALGSIDLRTAAHDELVALVHETGETVTLEVLVGSDVLIIGELQGRFLLGSVPELGMRWPAYATSSGKVLLALTRPAPVIGDLIKRTPRTIVSRRVFERELERVRLDGYATACDELEPGFSAAAAPIRNHLGDVIGALSINGPTVRLSAQRLKTLAVGLRRAADRISRRLGATPAMLHTEGIAARKSTKPPPRNTTRATRQPQ